MSKIYRTMIKIQDFEPNINFCTGQPLFDVDQLNLTNTEKEIYDCLGSEPVHIE